MKKKFKDEDVILLNSVGLSTTTIGKLLNVNHSAVHQRLKQLNVAPFYPRGKSRAAMEDIFFELSPEEKVFFCEKAKEGVKAYLVSLIRNDYSNSVSTESTSGSTGLPTTD